MAQIRSSKKPASKREPKKEPKRQTLQDACRDMLQAQHEALREKVAAANAEKHRAEEDAMMAMMYGPDWRNKAPA